MSATASIPYQSSVLEQPAFTSLLACFPELSGNQWLSLNQLTRLYLDATGRGNIRFVSDEDVAALGMEHLYYEELIAQHGLVLTRERNWHDLFNALIWTLFPQTKATLSAQHQQDILEYGLNPRTPRRNRLTHFDECGVVLAYSHPQIPEALTNHQWREAMHTRRTDWGRAITPLVFGHANYEMLLNPFIGLTGKWLGIKVAPDFHRLNYRQQCQEIDTTLATVLEEQDPMASKGSLKPLPLLGVPGWDPRNLEGEFYANQDYFRPKRSAG